MGLGDLVYGTEDDEIEDAALALVAAAGAVLATVEIATQGQVAAMLAQAAGRSHAGSLAGGIVLSRLAAGRSVVELAGYARDELKATHGLAVGPVVSADDGLETVAIALVGPSGAETVTHRLGGSGSLRLSRAAKTALDLVRKRLQLHS